MVVVDTSALMAVLLLEARGTACAGCMADAERLAISAATFTEALIVAEARGVREELEALVTGLGFEVEKVTAQPARRAADAYGRFGKGHHAARLNFGDAFAFALAEELDWPLLYVGDDFAATGITPALT